MAAQSPARQDILVILSAGPRNATQLAALLNRQHTNICRDLRALRDAGLVKSRREGVYVVWSSTERGW